MHEGTDDTMPKPPYVLLVNPWITDFAAFDLWAKPLGLLALAALLRQGGCGVGFIDCLDRDDPFTNRHPEISPGKDRAYGTGKYPRALMAKPDAIRDIPRNYYRYGIHPESYLRRLTETPKPDMVWMTCSMTYWYPGVQLAVGLLRRAWPEVPVWLGGTYARLCPGHARRWTGATAVCAGTQAEMPEVLKVATGFSVRNRPAWETLAKAPVPALDLLGRLRYAPILTGTGCPYRCPYCASGLLQPRRERRSADAVFNEIAGWHQRYGVADFAFYDDALLIDAEDSLKPALKRVARELPGLRFHTPNALHVRQLSAEWCDLLAAAGFRTLRLGLETTRPERQRQWGGKVEETMFREAAGNLRASGFTARQIGVYLLCGLPGQNPSEVAEAIEAVEAEGACPYLAEYSPIPGTPMWRQAVAESPYPVETEPLTHNNTFFAVRRPDFSLEDLETLKEKARRSRRRLLGDPPGGWRSEPALPH